MKRKFHLVISVGMFLMLVSITTMELAHGSQRDIEIQEIYVEAYRNFESKKYEECIRLCDNILLMYPNHTKAKNLKERAEKTIYSDNLRENYRKINNKHAKNWRMFFEYHYIQSPIYLQNDETKDANISDLPSQIKVPYHAFRFSLVGYSWALNDFIRFGGNIWAGAGGHLGKSWGIRIAGIRVYFGGPLVPFNDFSGMQWRIGANLGWGFSYADYVTSKKYDVDGDKKSKFKYASKAELNRLNFDNDYFFNFIFRLVNGVSIRVLELTLMEHGIFMEVLNFSPSLTICCWLANM